MSLVYSKSYTYAPQGLSCGTYGGSNGNGYLIFVY